MTGTCLSLSSARAEVIIDGTVSAVSASHAGSALGLVFVSDQVAYAFYRDQSNVCVYSKSTNGGATWGAAVTVHNTSCIRVVVWYDQWTPGVTTGSNIHIATMTTRPDALYYNRLDTATDTLLLGSNPVSISGGQGATFAVGSNYQSMTRTANGTLYVGVADTSDSYVLRCSANCNLAASWTEVGTNPLAGTNGEDPTLLAPLSNNDVLLIRDDVSTNRFESKVWNNTSATWAGSWTTIDPNSPENSVYDAGLALSADLVTGDIYFTYISENDVIGNDNVHTGIFSNTARAWTMKADVVTNLAGGVTGVTIARDTNLGETYIAYATRRTLSPSTTASIYYKVSTDNMTTWGARQGPLNTVEGDFYGLDLNFMNGEKIYVMWVDDNPKILYGSMVKDLIPPTFEQSSYRFYFNLDSTDVGGDLAGVNTPATLVGANMKFRLRQLLHVGGDGMGVGTKVFKLQFVGKGTGTCASPSGGTPATYTDVTNSTVIAYTDNATPVDASALTVNTNDPTHLAHTIRNQSYEEANTFASTQSKIFTGEDGKWDFALRDNSAPVSTTYCFRVVYSNGTSINTYTVYPEIRTSNGLLAVDIVDASNASVSAPSIVFPPKNFSFDPYQSSTTIGTTAQKIRVTNGKSTPTWTLSLAASSPSALWTNGTDTYDFNGTAAQGRLTVTPTASTIVGPTGCPTTGLSKGSSTAFLQGVIDSVTLVNADSSATAGCYWDITGVGLAQDIPGGQPAGTYTIDLVLTAV